ncbi:MAG: arginine deiminase-related protein [Pseudomonadota bacterium]
MSASSQSVSHTASTVLMVRPYEFFSNPDTARTNAFQTDAPADATARVQSEFDAMVEQLRAVGVQVVVLDDSADPVTPDAVFPNNWVSTHADGTLVLYPMEPESRRPERRADAITALFAEHGFEIRRLIDYTHFEADAHFLEGTGSLVLDRVHHRAYACYSARTHATVLRRFCEDLGYEPVGFQAQGQDGTPIYHTNVMMAVGTRVAIACLDAIRDSDRRRVETALRSEHELVAISHAQTSAFAGNMLEVSNEDGEAILVMSGTARAALDTGQVEALSAHCTLVPVDVPTIETSGGSVRCMLAEVFLPQRERL